MSHEIDLFENHESQLDNLRAVTEHYWDELESERDGAVVCQEFLRAVQELGYTFEYDLCCCPYDLRPVSDEAVLGNL